MFCNKMTSTIAAFCLSGLWGTIQLLEARDLQNCVPRKTVAYQPENLNIFWKPGLSNFSTLLVSEETNTLYAGAKDYILALDLNDISKEITREVWFAPEDRQLECLRRGKSKAECQNYILLLHEINATSFYICGTNAFHPACRYMVIDDRKLKLQSKAVESRGRCPFEPRTRYASLMVDGALYSATSNNFLGTEPIILRSLRNPLRTEFKASWLNEPTFIHIDLVQESNASSDTDRIYVFFTETAVEFEFYDKLLVSRMAQICKGDLGGKRTLKKKWTSFLKATLVCSAPESDFQFNVLQAVFVFKTTNWRETIFYGIFTQQWGRLDISAVCAFKMEAVKDVFLKGNFKGPVAVENSHTKWVVHRADVPTPRPGAPSTVGWQVSSATLSRWIKACISRIYESCASAVHGSITAPFRRSASTSASFGTRALSGDICSVAIWSRHYCLYRQCLDNSAQRQEYSSSLDLPDRVLQFVRDHPLMDSNVDPVGRQPVLLKRGTRYTQLVVDRTRGLDNATYDIFFLGTDKGYLHKAVNLQGAMFIVEELQLFPSLEPVQTLKLAPQKGLFYAGSPSHLVQIPVATCSQYKCCFDCVLARDPYCAWSLSLRSCILVTNQSGGSQDLIQCVRNGDASRCPEVEKNIRRYPVALGSSPHLSCTPLSNLAKSVWTFNGSHLQEEEAKYLFHAEGLVVFNVTADDIGLYECQSVEMANGREFSISVSACLLYPQQERDFIMAPKSNLSNQMCAISAATKSQLSASPQMVDPARLEQPQGVRGLSFTLMLWGSTFALLFLSLLSWNFYKGHLSLPWKTSGSRRSEVAGTVGQASLDLSLGQTVLTQEGFAACPIATSTSESGPLVNSSKDECGVKAKQSTSLAKGGMVCGSSNCLVMNEALL